MAELILKNQGVFNASYEGATEPITFYTNEVEVIVVTDLVATKSADQTHWVNGPLGYTIVVTNNSGEELTNVHLVDNINTVIARLDYDYGVYVNDVPVVYTYSAGELSLYIASLASGASATITFQVLPA